MSFRKIKLILELPFSLISRGMIFPEAYWVYQQHKLKKRHGSISNYIISNNKLYWSRYAPLYSRTRKEIFEEHKYFLDRLKALKPDSILEVGCGAGRMLRYIIKELDYDAKIYGIDISPNMLKETKKHPETREVNLITADAKSLPFKNNNFDLIFTVGILMYLSKEDIETAISDFKRVLAPTGCIILLESAYGIWEDLNEEGSLLNLCRHVFKKHSLAIASAKNFDDRGMFVMIAER